MRPSETEDVAVKVRVHVLGKGKENGRRTWRYQKREPDDKMGMSAVGNDDTASL